MRVRLAAAQTWQPRAVVIGPAVRAVFEPIPAQPIDLAVATGVRPQPWVRLHRFEVPDVVEVRGIRMPSPAWNAVWQAPLDGGAAIDEYLRNRGELADLQRALEQMPGNSQQALRRRLVAESRSNPWSRAERELHRLLHDHHIKGWVANARIETACGVVFGDVLFRREQLCVEADGFRYHADRHSFEADRARLSELVAAGWRVQQFTWQQLTTRPEWVAGCIRRALASAR